MSIFRENKTREIQLLSQVLRHAPSWPNSLFEIGLIFLYKIANRQYVCRVYDLFYCIVWILIAQYLMRMLLIQVQLSFAGNSDFTFGPITLMAEAYSRSLSTQLIDV